MKNEMAFKDSRLLESLEYIDRELIAEAVEGLKLPDGQQHASAGRRRTLAYSVALAACLILLSMAFPVVTRFVSSIGDFFAGRGSGTTEESLDALTSSNSEIDTDNTDSLTESPYTTSEITTMPLYVPPEPDYLRFTPELETVTQEEMIAVNKAWSVVVYNRIYQSEYIQNIYIYYMSEEEAAKIADERATKLSEEYSYCFFNYWGFSLYGYIGKFADYIILMELDKDGVDEPDMIIGTYNTGDHRWYAYKDGVIYSLKDIYECGYITDEQLDIIANRMEQYLDASFHYWPSDYEKNKENKTE